jgi:hypothetical protein
LSIFQQNREKWQKRASSTSIDTPLAVQPATQPQAAVTNQRPQSAILTRKQPDLVMDLPPPSQQDNVTPPLSSGSTSASSSMTSLDKQVINDEANGSEYDDADETLGDHFAKQNQSTLKKNEKFGSIDGSGKKIAVEKNGTDHASSSKASKIEDIVLRIEETGEAVSDVNRLSTGSQSSLMKIEMEKSPIPIRNTQKFVSKFADLKLTGGSRTITKAATTPTEPIITQPEKTEKERASFSFGSFKPSISIKPQVLTKKKSIFLQAHSSAPGGGSSSENQQ